MLSHYLVLRAATDAVGYVHRILAGFEVDEDPTEARSPRTPERSSRVRLVGSDGRLALYFGRELLIDGDDERTVLEHLLWPPRGAWPRVMERVLVGAACARVTFGNLDDAVAAIVDLADGSSP